MAKAKQLKENEDYVLEKEKEQEEAEPYIILNLKPDVKKVISDLIINQVSESKNDTERKNFIKKLEYARLRYQMVDYDTEWPWEGASKRRTGSTTIAIDRLTPRMKKAMMQTGDIWDVEPEKGNSEENARKQKKALNDIARNEMKLEQIIDNTLHDAIAVNFGVLKNQWQDKEDVREETTCYETAQELVRNYPDAIEKYEKYVLYLTGYKTIEELNKNHLNKMTGEIDYSMLPRSGKKLWLREKYRARDIGERPCWVDPARIYFPPGTIDSNEAWYTIEEQDWTYEELIEAKESGFFEEVDEIIEDVVAGEAIDYGKSYKVYEAILEYDIDGDGLPEKCVFFIAEGKTKGAGTYLRGIRYPFFHNRNYYIIFRTMKNRYGFYDGGMAQKLKSVNESEDKRVNQISNAWDQAIVKARMRVVKPNSPYNPRIHKYYPGADIPVSDPNELTEFKTSDIPSSSITLVNDNRIEEELLSGIPKYGMSGQPSPQDPNSPARKTEFLMSQADANIVEFIKYFSFGLIELGEQTQSNYYQFSGSDEISFRADEGLETITKNEMRAKIKMTTKTAIESISNPDKARSNIALLKTVGTHPLIAQDIDIQWELIKNIMTFWDNEWARRAEKLLTDEKKNMIKARLQQQAQLAAQAQQQQQQQAIPAEEGAMV